MAGQTISGATSTTPATTDYIPLARPGDTTARYTTVGNLNSTPLQGNFLSSDAASSATSITTSAAPKGVVANATWVVIDPYTSQCEIRKVTAVSGSTFTVAALTYSHSANDGVIFTDQPWANVKWFGAKGDNSTDDQAFLNAALDQMESIGGGVVYAPYGIYLVSVTLDIGANVSLIGDGIDTVFKATAAISVITIENVGGSGNQVGRCQDFFIDGDSTASIGMDLELSVRRVYDNVRVENCTTAWKLDNCQNNNFISCSGDTCTTALYVTENSSNNSFLRGNWSDFGTYGLQMDTSVLADPSGNIFENCLFEQSTSATHACLITNGARNSFINCTFGNNTNDDIIALAAGAVDNVFDTCLVTGDRANHLPVVDDDGSRNKFVHCRFQNTGGGAFTAGDDIIDCSGDWTWIDDSWFRLGEAVGNVRGPYSFGPATVIQLASDTLTIPDHMTGYIRVRSQSDGATDDLAIINGGVEGQVIVLETYAQTQDITVKHQGPSGNIFLAGAADFVLDNINDKLTLIKNDSPAWNELSQMTL